MSQDIREYDLKSIDQERYGTTNEADRLSVTATVDPTVNDQTRGVQLTLDSQDGTVYGRLSEQQVVDLINTLRRRIDDSDESYEATLSGSGNHTVNPDGTIPE